MTKKVFIQLFAIIGLAALAQYAHEEPAYPATWRLPQPIGEAHAYKVQKVCEEIHTKNGPRERCRSVLLKEEPGATSPPPKDEKKDAAKGGAGHGPSH
ncbi:MAG: hypothetical protein EBT83_09225 [Betaproteobacteria bacterium]|jgi:hypothetical protein|nr:hypothetical protein [Betaproteobacteria bacterium]